MSTLGGIGKQPLWSPVCLTIILLMETPLSCHLSFGALKVSRESGLVWMDWQPPNPGVVEQLLADLDPEERLRVQAEWNSLCHKIQKIISKRLEP